MRVTQVEANPGLPGCPGAVMVGRMDTNDLRQEPWRALGDGGSVATVRIPECRDHAARVKRCVHLPPGPGVDMRGPQWHPHPQSRVSALSQGANMKSVTALLTAGLVAGAGVLSASAAGAATHPAATSAGSAGRLLATLNDPLHAEADGFGNSVAVSGTTAVVGSWATPDGSQTAVGTVDV